MENVELRKLAVEFCKNHNYANEDDIYIFLVELEVMINGINRI